MTRVKFLLFALVVLGLWVGHLVLMSSAVGGRAVDQATLHSALAPTLVGAKLNERRLELQKALLKLTTSAAFINVGRVGRDVALGADRFNAVRNAAREAVPESLREQLVVGLVNEAGALYARGAAAPVTDAKELDVAALMEAGAEGQAQTVWNAPYLFYSSSYMYVSGNDTKPMVTVVLGAPLATSPSLEALTRETALSALGLFQAGKLVVAGGAESALLMGASGQVKAGKTATVSVGEVQAVGPFKLPMLTAGKDFMGGGAPLTLGSRNAITSTPYEVVALVSTRPMMKVLADYQVFALAALVGLVGLTLVWSLIIGTQSESTSPVRESQAAPRYPSGLETPGRSGSALPPMAEMQVPEASPDDFQFGEPPRPPLEPLNGNEKANDLFDPSSVRPESFGGMDSDNQPTMAYPVQPGDLPPPPENDRAAVSLHGYDEVGPDATRVANVPDELLRASSKPAVSNTHSGFKSSARSAAPPPVPLAAPSSAPNDEQHFQEVFRDFVSTRERCGEPPDGITYDKFAVKLRKNREQLMQKYQCKSVRFQVYVKEGKAALKATPVKE